MFRVNLEMIEKMTKEEKRICEVTYLDLAYTYFTERSEAKSGSEAMRIDPESIFCSYSRAERKAYSTFKELFMLNQAILAREGMPLIGFVSKENKTAKNVFNAWSLIYFRMEEKKNRKLLEEISKIKKEES